ncbi:MAG: hypothetical protein GX771_10920 [Halomonadaceae bacterium]|nr:hypothetical protein [Halomonadaceae bacterium]
MYHVTPRANLPSILQDGLEPRIGERSEALGEAAPRIYCFPTLADCNDALGQWLGDWFNDEEELHGEPIELAILELDRSQVPACASEVEWELCVSERIAPEAIVKVWSEEDIGRAAVEAGEALPLEGVA